DLGKFQGYLHQQGVGPIQQVSSDTIRRFLASLHAAQLSQVSSARCLSAVRGWLRFLRQERMLHENPALEVAAGRRGLRLPKTLSTREVTALLELPAQPTPEDQR